MRIGIDATCWWNTRGFGRYTRQLLTAMFEEARGHEFHLFIDREPAQAMQRPGVSIVRPETGSTVTTSAVAAGHRSLGDVLAFRRAVRREPIDVMYFPAVYSYYPTGGRMPVVITFHDAIAERFPQLVFPDLRGRLLWSLKVWLARWDAACITTVSCAAREEIARYLRVDRDRITVIHEAADACFMPCHDAAAILAARQRAGIADGKRLILYVGGIAPHKNLVRLVKAYALALGDEGMHDVHLAFVGDPEGAGFHSDLAAVKDAVDNDHRLTDRVHFTGFLPDEDLALLYSDALAVAMPSLSEGFGLPAVEAISCGTPVIAARGGAVAEVVGPAGLFFDPLDTTEIAAAIRRVASDPEQLGKLRAACPGQAARFSWSRTASATLDVLERQAGGR